MSDDKAQPAPTATPSPDAPAVSTPPSALETYRQLRAQFGNMSPIVAAFANAHTRELSQATTTPLYSPDEISEMSRYGFQLREAPLPAEPGSSLDELQRAEADGLHAVAANIRHNFAAAIERQRKAARAKLAGNK